MPVPATAAPPVDTLLSHFAEPLRRQLAQQALQHDKVKVEKILRDIKLYKGWASQSLPKRQDLLASYTCFDAALCRLVLHGWLKRNELLRQRVWTDLQAAGYEPALPDWRLHSIELPYQSLLPDDVLTEGDQQYFAPDGTRATGVALESYTLMAHLLGWSTMAPPDEEIIKQAVPEPAPTETTAALDDMLEAAPANPGLALAPAAVTVPLAADQPVPASITQPERAIDQLEAAMYQLAADYEEAARQLRMGKWPPTLPGLSVTGLQQMAAQLGQQAGAASIAVPTPAQLRQQLAQLREAEQQRQAARQNRQRAVEVLAAVARVRHRQVASFAALEQAQAQATALVAQLHDAPLTDGPPHLLAVEADLLAGIHPLARFLNLVRQAEELADDTPEMQQAEELMQDIGGRELARAWLRGNLLVQLGDEQRAAISIPAAPLVELPAIEAPVALVVPVPAQAVVPAALAPANQLVPPPLPASSLPTEGPVSTDPMSATETLEPEVSQETPLVDAPPHLFDPELKNCSGELPNYADQTEPDVENATSTPTDQGFGQRQWELLAQGDLSLAYQLARCAEELNQADASRLPAWLLRSLALGPHVQAAYGRLATLLAEDSRKFDQQQLAAAPGEPTECRQLLAWAAALRPALLAPATLLNGWLSLDGVPGLTRLNDLANRLAKRQSVAPLDEALLDALQTHQQWQTQAQSWQADLDEWSRQQEQAKFRQSITNDIVQFWRSLWQPGRPVAQVLARLATPDPNHGELLDALAALRNRSGLRDELKRSKIDFSIHIQNNTDAQRWLDERVALLADLVRQHQELWHRRPAAASRKDTHYDDQDLLHYLHQQLPAVLAELTSAEADSATSPLPWRVALALLRQSVAQLHSWLAHPAPGYQEVLPRYWLGPALLRVPGLELTADWEPLAYDQPLEQQLWHLAEQGPVDWQSLYEAASQETSGADHLATARLLALAEATADSPQSLPMWLGQELATLRTARQASIERQRYQLGREVDKVERELVRGYRYGYLGGEADVRAQQDVKELKSYAASGEPTQAEVQRLRQNSQSQSELDEDSIFNFRAHQQAIRRLHAHMADLRHQAVAERTAEVAQELQTLISPPSPDDQRKLHQALQEGRLTLVDDYLARLRVGRDLGPHDLAAAVPCMAHLRARLLALAEVRQQYKPAALARQLARVPLLPEGRPAAATEGVAEAYSQWAEIRQNKTLVGESSQPALRHLFEFLGFEVEALEPAQVLDRTGPQYVDLRARTLRDRQQCPVGRFGSEAKGRYRVLSIWNTPDPTELSRLVAKCSNRDSAVLVLLWEALPWPQREELGLHCRREGLSFLVFDELLFLYLLTFAAPAKRLGLFFQLQLPFTQLNPYQVSGKIPSEMFFGREQEKRRLVSHQADGAIIVYGGRQLGKTMLLHQAVRENHCPEEERYVVFRDIYQLGRDIQNINRLAYELMQLCRSQQIGEWPVSWREDITPRRVLDHLTAWVLAHPHRTLLVLLDEADELLEQDAANDFALVSELRRAMDNCRTKDESGARLKIVFSGLHNVQRTLNLPNQPFVQLGKPMNIGPLEPEQGIALVRSPLESLGFCFGQLGADGLYQPAEALLDQIAVETNYYPSLMQIFCHRLLERLYQRQQRHATLLTDITEEDVQYASQSARAEINNRFDLTLDLNPRYRLLAFIIADLTTQAAGLVTHERGLLPLEVREFALEYWPAGWKIRHEESYFKALLDEMVELGVLEKSQANQGGWRYRLRTANVRAWLGSPEAIRKVLNDFANELPNTEYQPDIVRARFPAGPRARLARFRGPLTVAAVGRLEAEPAPLALKTGRVSIVCGTRAAGLGMLSDFLSRRFQGNFEEVPNLTKFGPLGDKLDELLADRTAAAMKVVQVVLVTGNCTGKWVQQALDKLRPGKRRRRPIHVVFEIDPATLRRFLSADITLENLQAQEVELLPLTPWEPFAVKRWLEEEMLAGGSWREVAETTGGWHLPLHEFYDLESKHGETGAGAHLRRIGQELQAGRYAADFHTAEARPFLRELARDWGPAPFSLEDAELVNTEALGPDDLRRELRWAEMLRLIRPLKDGKYEFDPVAAAALRHES